MGLLVAFAAMTAAPQQNAGEPLNGLIPVVGMTYDTHHGGHPKCYCLRGDYGFLIVWGDKNPPEFYVYEKKPARLSCLSSFEDLLEWIKKLPEGAKASWIKSCGSTWWNMAQDKLDLLQKVWAPKEPSDKDAIPEGYCVCESKGVTLFKSLQEGCDWIRSHEGCIDSFTGKPIITAKTEAGLSSQNAVVRVNAGVDVPGLPAAARP